MKRLVVVGLLALLTACAGQPYPEVPVEEKGYGVPPSRATSAPLTSPVPAASIAPPGDESAPMSKTRPAQPPSPAVSMPAKPSASVAPPSTRRYAGPSPALLALMEQADRYESQGNQQAALAQLERAQRIAPRDPMVYLQLARLRLHMNDRPRAEQLARRGLSLAGGDPDLESAFKALLNELER